MEPCPYCGQRHAPSQPCDAAGRRLDVLQMRVQLEQTSEDERGWEFEGLAIPYGEELERLDWLTGATRWLFEPGSVVPTENAQLFYGHDHMSDGMPIGRSVSFEQTDAGLRQRLRISKTAKGAEVRTLLLDGVLDRLSVGLDRSNAQTRVEDADSDAPLLVWENVPAWETSVVPLPAYDSAKIDAVLHKTTPTLKGTNKMDKCDKCGATLAAGVTSCPTCAANASLEALQGTVDTLSGSLDTVTRQIATLGESGGAGGAPVEIPGNTYGEFLQMLAANDERAMAFLAFVGTTTDELIAADWLEGTWVGDLTRRLVERRRVLNIFRTRPLPAKGMTVEHGRLLAGDADRIPTMVDGKGKTLDTSGVNVGEQLNEGDLLAYGKLAFDAAASSPVRTFGGWGDMSRQTVERSSIGVVELFFEALFQRYLRVTEAAARAAAVLPANATVAQTTAASDLTDADGWTDFVIDASFALEDNGGYPLEFLMVSRSRFKTLANLRTGPADDAPYLLNRNTGTIDVTGLRGELFNVPVVPINVAGDLVRAGCGDAITTFEAPGAPFRLQDDDITNLTKAFSMYGYCSFASTVPGALIRPTEVADVE